MALQELLKTVSPTFTEQVILDIVKTHFNWEDANLKEIKVNNSSKKGDSYLSSLVRFSVVASCNSNAQNGDEKEEFLPIILKNIPSNIARKKTFRSVDFFETEIYFYEKLWPAMKKVKDLRGLNDEDEVPLYLSGSCVGSEGYVALKDLTPEGYRSIERTEGFSNEYVDHFLKLLAKFHALSLACKEFDPKFEGLAKETKETYFAEKFRPWYDNFQTNKLFPVFRNAVSQYLPSSYLQKMNKLFESDFYSVICEKCTVKNKLSVVTQSDCWIPNFLVKVDNGKLINSVLIDFQLARYTTLSNDVVMFLYACCNQDDLVNNWDDFIKTYHKYLTTRLEELGCKQKITLEELQEDIQQNGGIFGFGMAMEAIVMSLLEENEVANLDSLQGEQAVPLESVWDISPFQDEARNKRLAFLVKHAVDKGFIQ